jgi:hypothetical protein
MKKLFIMILALGLSTSAFADSSDDFSSDWSGTQSVTTQVAVDLACYFDSSPDDITLSFNGTRDEHHTAANDTDHTYTVQATNNVKLDLTVGTFSDPALNRTAGLSLTAIDESNQADAGFTNPSVNFGSTTGTTVYYGTHAWTDGTKLVNAQSTHETTDYVICAAN